MAKVVISGNYFPHGDIKYLQRADDLEIVSCPKLELITDSEIDQLTEQAKTADLLIVALFGTNSDALYRLKLDRIGTRKVLWSFDSHHSCEKEKTFQKYFDTYFLAHSLFLNRFDNIKTEWLPGCYIRFDLDHVNELRLRSLIERDYQYDIVFPFKPYNTGDRIAIVKKIAGYLNKAGLKYYFGPVNSGMPYMNLILKSRLVLNISLLDDLNIRNFEAWALNRKMLTNKVSDHDKLTNIDYSSTYFFDRCLSDFEQVFNKAYSGKSTIDTSVDVLNNHMLIHRYIEIINKSLGSNYHMKSFYREEQEITETVCHG